MNAFNKKDSKNYLSLWLKTHNTVFNTGLSELEFSKALGFKGYQNLMLQVGRNIHEFARSISNNIDSDTSKSARIVMLISENDVTYNELINTLIDTKLILLKSDFDDEQDDFYGIITDDEKELIIKFYCKEIADVDFEIHFSVDRRFLLDFAFDKMTLNQKISCVDENTEFHKMGDLKFEPFFREFIAAIYNDELRLNRYQKIKSSIKELLLEGLERDLIGDECISDIYHGKVIHSRGVEDRSLIASYIWLNDDGINEDINKIKFHLYNVKQIYPKNIGAKTILKDDVPSFDQFLTYKNENKADILFYHLIALLHKGKLTLERLYASHYTFKELDSQKYADETIKLIKMFKGDFSESGSHSKLSLIFLLDKSVMDHDINSYNKIIGILADEGFFDVILNKKLYLITNKKITSNQLVEFEQSDKLWINKINSNAISLLTERFQELFYFFYLGSEHANKNLNYTNQQVKMHNLFLANKILGRLQYNQERLTEISGWSFFSKSKHRISHEIPLSYAFSYHVTSATKVTGFVINQSQLCSFDKESHQALHQKLNSSIQSISKKDGAISELTASDKINQIIASSKKMNSKYPESFSKVLCHYGINYTDIESSKIEFINKFNIFKDGILFIVNKHEFYEVDRLIKEYEPNEIIYLGDLLFDFTPDGRFNTNEEAVYDYSQAIKIVINKKVNYPLVNMIGDAEVIVKKMDMKPANLIEKEICHMLPAIKINNIDI